MKTLNELENQLSAWVPSPPSQRLRARIFGLPKAEPGWGWNQTGLAFASVLGLALVVAIRQNPPSVASGDQTMLAAAMSNQDLAAYVAKREDVDWNRPTAAFQCTNIGAASAAGQVPRRTQLKK